MLKKIGNLLFKNLGLKIAALVISIILWYVVLNINDPAVSKSFSCPVTVENADVLTNMGKTYEIVDGSTAYFNVKAPRSIMKSISAADFKAYADMENLQDMSYIPIEVVSTRYTAQVEIMKKNENMEIETEDLMSGQYIITAEQLGTPTDGFVVGSLSVSPNVLKVSGPASVVQSISKVVATIDVGGVATNISDSVIPTLLDEDGNTIDATRLTSNLSTVIVRADILNTREVPVTADYTGEPADGYSVISVTCRPDTVRIMGDSTSLNSVQSIAIPKTVLDATGIREDIETVVDISPYLPEGLTLVNASDKNVTVNIDVEAMMTRNVRVPTANITVNGGAEGMEAVFAESAVSVPITGFHDDLVLLNGNNITGSIDISGFAAGEHKANLTLDLDPERFKVNEAVSVEFTLRRAN